MEGCLFVDLEQFILHSYAYYLLVATAGAFQPVNIFARIQTSPMITYDKHFFYADFLLLPI